jgi:hypothetical protein
MIVLKNEIVDIYNKDGKGNIYDENRDETIDVIYEKPDFYALKQLVDLGSCLNKSANVPTNGTTIKRSAERSTKYMEYGL